MSKRRVFFYVQHLLGIGHLKRAVTLARAMAAAGMEVTLASGGAPVPELAAAASATGVHFVQLPPASAADLTFKVLVDGNGKPVDDTWKSARAEALLAAWRAAGAQVLLVELFPFGRRQMRFELLLLLDAAESSGAAIACSVRDVLGAQKSVQRQEETLALLERYFDQILVHGDPGAIAFERSFPLAGRIAARIEYTGYVVDDAKPAAGNAGAGEVIVSAGGGAVGAGLLAAAIQARPICTLHDRKWRMLAGDNLPAADYQALARLVAGAGGAKGGIELERSRPDFTTLLANCVLSVSQAGYNTLMETVGAGARAVMVPFARGQETEQTLRARCFAERGLLEMVEESELTPATLAAAIDRAAQKPRVAGGGINLDGARESARLLEKLALEREA